MVMNVFNAIRLFMRRPAYGSLLLTQHAGRAASSGEDHSPTRLDEKAVFRACPFLEAHSAGIERTWAKRCERRKIM